MKKAFNVHSLHGGHCLHGTDAVPRSKDPVTAQEAKTLH
jgi:hypothetical protein